MSSAVRVVWDDALASYDFGQGHPLAPLRVELTVADPAVTQSHDAARRPRDLLRAAQRLNSLERILLQ